MACIPNRRDKIIHKFTKYPRNYSANRMNEIMEK